MNVDANAEDERVHQMMMAALDGEISDADQRELDRRIAAEPRLDAEWRRLQRVKEVTASMVLRSPPAEMWETYWVSVYHRFERGVGWIFASIGAIVLVIYTAWIGVRDILADAAVPTFVKGAILFLIVGGAILLVSVTRERLFTHRDDPYKDVHR